LISERRKNTRSNKFATVRQPDGGTAVNGAAGPQNGSPNYFAPPAFNPQKRNSQLWIKPNLGIFLNRKKWIFLKNRSFRFQKMSSPHK
jgi:hypothetical protein